MLPNRGAVLGIDVGYSERRPTTCLCLLEWADDLVQLSFKKVGTDPTSRTNALCGLFPNPERLAAVAIDGPLTRGLRLVTHYRIADALFSRGVFQKRGKPGQTSSPVGQRLHDHATRLAELLVECAARDIFSIAPAVHIEPIHETALVESFPNQFLGSLIDESNLPVLNRDASDRYWEYLATSGGLEILLRTLLEPCRFEVQPAAIKDHDERAAVTCALTALAVAAESAVGVGDAEDGDIFLPPTAIWGTSCSESSPWIEAALRKNVNALRRSALRASGSWSGRVRLHDMFWF